MPRWGSDGVPVQQMICYLAPSKGGQTGLSSFQSGIKRIYEKRFFECFLQFMA